MSIENDAKRFLAQQAQHRSRLWVAPPGNLVETAPQPEPEAEAPAEPMNAVDKVPLQPETMASNREQSPMQASQDWSRGAPEPEPVVPVPGEIEDPFPAYTDLDSFRNAIHRCEKCPLGKTRNEFVFGAGDPKARLVLVGEAPGAEEDKKGEPFVGRAGQLLDKILAAIDLKRGEDVFICNILKCRPPNNRDPQPSEVEQCEPHLVKQLQLLQPKLILALGRISAQTLLRTSESLTSLRGKVHDYHGVGLMVTYHPAALLRNPKWKHPTWEDVQAVKKYLDDLS